MSVWWLFLTITAALEPAFAYGPFTRDQRQHSQQPLVDNAARKHTFLTVSAVDSKQTRWPSDEVSKAIPGIPRGDPGKQLKKAETQQSELMTDIDRLKQELKDARKKRTRNEGTPSQHDMNMIVEGEIQVRGANDAVDRAEKHIKTAQELKKEVESASDEKTKASKDAQQNLDTAEGHVEKAEFHAAQLRKDNGGGGGG